MTNAMRRRLKRTGVLRTVYRDAWRDVKGSVEGQRERGAAMMNALLKRAIQVEQRARTTGVTLSRARWLLDHPWAYAWGRLTGRIQKLRREGRL